MSFVLPIFAMLATILHTAPDLQPLQWHNRVVVAFADTESDNQLQEQLQLLENEKHGVEERDMRVFAVVGNSATTEALRQSVRCPRAGFAVVLIGKDGGPKLHQTHPVRADELFRTIDRMPMRRDEMRQK